MSEYVSKEELKEFFESIEITVTGRTRAKAIGEVLQAIYNGVMELPTTDAEPVIRCKDCARNPNNGNARTICPCPMDRYMGPEGYCSKAEPKEADG